MDFRAIQRHMAKAHQPCLLADHEHLNEQAAERLKGTAAQVADSAMVRLLIAGEHPKVSVFQASLLDLAGNGQTDAVGVQKEHHHLPRVACLSRLVDPLGGRQCESPQDRARPPYPGRKIPGGSPAATPPAAEGRAVSAGVPGAEGLGLDNPPVLPPRTIVVTSIWKVLGTPVESSDADLCATHSQH